MDRGYAKRKLLKKDTQKAAVFGAVLICAAAFTAALTGCVSTQAETEKIRDMKYEVIEEEDIPKLVGFLKKAGSKWEILLKGNAERASCEYGGSVMPEGVEFPFPSLLFL